MSRIPTEKPKFKSTTIRAEVDRVDRSKSVYAVYQFTRKTFTKEDRPGKRPTS